MTAPAPALCVPEQLLLRLVPAAWSSAGVVMPDAVVRDEDWTAAVQLALAHGMTGLMCHGLLRLPAATIPSGMAEAASAFLADAEAQGRTRLDDLFAVLDTLEAAQVPALAFKGPALGELAYGRAWIRPSRDLDVLVCRADMDRAIAALAGLGYRSDEADLSPRATAACHDYVGQAILFAEGRAPVEPHCAFAPAALAIRLDMQGCRTRSRTIAVGGRTVRTLGAEDTVLTACLHGWKDKWWRLLWVADVAALLHRHPDLDWDALVARAEAAGIRRVLYLGAALARDLFGATLPGEVAAAIAREPHGGWLLQQSKARLFRPAGDEPSQNYVSRYHLLARERRADRLRYLWRTVTTPRAIHFRMLKLPDRLFHGYFAVKLIHDYCALPVWRAFNGRRVRARRAAPQVNEPQSASARRVVG